MAEQSMRERVADGARKYLTRCANLGTSIDYADLADAVLAEIETPTEGMVQAMHDVRNDPATGLMRSGVASDEIWAAGVRAAREGR